MAKSKDETGNQRILKKEKQRRNSDRQKEILKCKGIFKTFFSKDEFFCVKIPFIFYMHHIEQY